MQPIQAARHAEGECKAVDRYVQHYNAAVNHYCMKELKMDRRKINRPRVDSVLGGGRKNIHPLDILPYLPNKECFFDSRHWLYGIDILPFSVTTRIAANNQQFLKIMDNKINLPEELKGKKFRIRKLTPKECFRLLGVEDKDIEKMQASGLSNSAQYKLAGNSIVVDVLYHIFRKLLVETQNEDTQPTLF